MMAELIAPPTSGFEWLLGQWPPEIGYWLVGGLVLMGVAVARWQTNAPGWLISLPVAWLLWQCLAATQTVDADLSRATLEHFTAGVVCFYLGLVLPEPKPGGGVFHVAHRFGLCGHARCGFWAAFWGLGGNAALLLHLHLSNDENRAAGLSEADCQRSDFGDAVLPQHPGGRDPAAAPAHSGLDFSGAGKIHDRGASIVGRSGCRRSDGLSLLVRLEGRLAPGAACGIDCAAPPQVFQMAETGFGRSGPRDGACGIRLEILWILPAGRNERGCSF